MSSYFIKKKKAEIEFEEILLDSRNKSSVKIDNYFDNKKIKDLQKVFVLVFAVFFFQLFYLQIIKSDYYSSISEKNYIRTVKIKSSRGIIYDRNMTQVVYNIPVFDLVMIPADFFKNREDIDTKVAELAWIIGESEESFAQKIEGVTPNSYEAFPIMSNIDKEKALVIDEKIKDMGGVELENSAIRDYIDGEYFSPIIGYSGKISQSELEKYPDYLLTDIVGKDGLELSYEEEMRGIYGTEEMEVDSLGRVNRVVGKAEPVSGNNLVLNIDAELQKRLYGEVAAAVEKFKGTGGSVVAIDPRNGAVLALVSYPSFNNNLFAGGISTSEYDAIIKNPNNPLFNRPIEGEYPPGSTFKPMMAAATLQENIISPTRQITDVGYIGLGGWTFVDWKAHGQVNLVKAIAQSCNVYFYTVGGGYGDITGLGVDRIKKYANLFGMGELTGIDIPGEQTGLIPDTVWKREVKDEPWYIGDTYHMSIGQGDVLATPLQIANYTAAIANGGTLYVPQIVDKIVDSKGNVVRDIESEVIREDFIDAENIEWVQKGMRENVISGSGLSLSVLEVESAGKTGTAQYAGNTKSHAWYTVYAPYENPEIVMAIMIEGGGEGHYASVPIAKEILSWYYGERLTGENPKEATTATP
ncbi:MAG: penicillin-binding protein 2 [Candidatus Pacebacteria bacterium]|nr:penicillin-binding protein 2 [Candidatus Paceibacterota bacterium]